MTNDFNIKPYELSLWDDSVQDGQIKEIKKCVISSHTMSSAAKAYNINLTRKVNGERQLTFTICARYYDETSGEEVLNPYLKLLTNERKVKLRQEKNGEKVWYDFIIKNVSEDSSNNTYTYTAKDQHAQELSKNGFNIVFDKELQNNTKTVDEFAEIILDGTDWDVQPSEPIIEYLEEPIYVAQLSNEIIATDMLTGETKQISALAAIYIPYSVQNESDDYFQFLYSDDYNTPSEELPKDDDGVLLRKYFRNYHVSEKPNTGNPELKLGYKGGKIVRSPKTIYDSKLEQYVSVYYQQKDDGSGYVTRTNENGKQIPIKYYGFTETEYQTPNFVQSIITNGYNFTSTTGWGTVIENGIASERELNVSPEVASWTEELENITTSIKTRGPVFNHGFFDSRTEINGLVAGQEYLLRLFIKKEGIYGEPGDIISSDDGVSIDICDYTIDGAHYAKRENGNSYFQIKNSNFNAPYLEFVLTANQTLSEKELSKSKIGIFLDFGKESNGKFKTVYIEEAWLFPKVLDDDENIVYPSKTVSSDKIDSEKIIKTKYYFFDPNLEDNKNYTEKEDIKFAYSGYDSNNKFELQYHTTPEKRRTITAKESNRFNLLQEVCETFEIWLDIQVEHDDAGRIIKKRIGFKEYVGKEKYNGFKYGINLNSIKRTLDSDKIASKLIVKQNSNEFAKNGFCTIARASSNPSGTNVIYNFDYYISQGLLGQEDTEAALYDSESGLYPRLLEQSKTLRELNDQAVGVSKNIVHSKAQVGFEEARLQGAEDQSLETRESLKDLTTFTYEELCKTELSTTRLEEEKNRIYTDTEYFQNNEPTEALIKEYARISGKEIEDVEAWLREDPQTCEETMVEEVAANSFLNWKKSDRIIPYMTKILTADRVKEEAEKNLENAQKVLREYEAELENIKEKQQAVTDNQTKIEQEFFNLYGRFIQEGYWISEDYIDDNLYYLDALSTLYTSAKPQVNYTINVFDMANIEGYENYSFDIGDKTFVEDTEFFGWTINKNGTKSPYREEVIISEVVEGIDDPAKNNLKIQNYKTQFDDLFQRIAATTEQLQYNTGRYERFTNAVEQDGSISYAALQQTVNENGLAIANAGAQTVSCDERGVITIDKAMPAKQVRIIGGGIYLTTDNGETWKTGITGDGINASIITTGQLNAGEVNIMTDTAPSHKWDNKGITAYKTSYNISDGKINFVNNATFVRFDEFGFYGIKDNVNFDARPIDDEAEYGVDKIQKNAIFSFTWDGVTIGKLGEGLRATADKLTIGGDSGFIATSSGLSIGNYFKVSEKGLTIGNWKVSSDALTNSYEDEHGKIYTAAIQSFGAANNDLDTRSAFYIQTKDDKTEYPFYVRYNGQLHAEKGDIGGWELGKSFLKSKSIYSGVGLFSGQNNNIAIGSMTTDKWRILGWTGAEDNPNYTFGLSEGGYLYAKNAEIEGKITANSGSIGGIEITENGGIRAVASYVTLYSEVQHSVLTHSTNNNITINNWGSSSAWYNYYYKIDGVSGTLYVKAGAGRAEYHFLEDYPVQNSSGNYVAKCLSHSSAATSAAQTLTIPSGAKYLLVNQSKEGTPTVENKPGFSISPDGTITAGKINASGVLSASAGSTLGSFQIDGNSIYSGTWGTSTPDVFLCSGTTGTYTIAEKEQAGWAIGVGTNFGVSSDGGVYATKGKIGGWNLTETGMFGDEVDGAQVKLFPNGQFFYTAENAGNIFFLVVYIQNIPVGGISPMGWVSINFEQP